MVLSVTFLFHEITGTFTSKAVDDMETTEPSAVDFLKSRK
jgi:hypothetical protein